MGLTNLSTQRQRIAELARTKRGVALSTLHHVIDLEWMKEAYRLTRKDGAHGIDGVTAADYATNLEANLLDLLDRIKSGRYKAPPVRRTYIPKSDGSRRPLGIVAQERRELFILLQEGVLEIGAEDMMAMLDLIDDGGELAARPAVKTGSEDRGNLVGGEPPQTKFATALE